MKQIRYMTIKEKREYLLEHDEMPLTFNPNIKLKKHKRGYVSTLITGGDSSLIVQVKKGTRLLIGSGEHASFVKIGNNKPKSKILSIFRK